MKICETCRSDVSLIIPNQKQAIDKDLQSYFPIKPEIIIKDSENIFNIDHLEPNKFIFYFAAMSKSIDNNVIKNKKQAYGRLTNSGMGKTDKNGKITIHLACPQIYKNEDGKIYTRHLHFVYWDTNKWDDQLFTIPIICSFDHLFISPKVRLIDARSNSLYKKFHVANSINLNEKNIDSMDDVEILKLLNVRNKNIPIIVYSGKNSKNAINVLRKLNRRGFYNIFYYPLGIKNIIEF